MEKGRMTTARDVIAEILKRWNIRAAERCADQIIAALAGAPDSIRQELAGLLLSGLKDTPPSTGRVPIVIDPTLPSNTFEILGAHGKQRFHLPTPPSEDKV